MSNLQTSSSYIMLQDNVVKSHTDKKSHMNLNNPHKVETTKTKPYHMCVCVCLQVWTSTRTCIVSEQRKV